MSHYPLARPASLLSRAGTQPSLRFVARAVADMGKALRVKDEEPAPDPLVVDDTQLVSSALRGEARAERAIWTQYSTLVRRIVSRSLGPTYDVEDVVQEVFMHLFNRLRQLRDPGALRAFLVAICVHRVRSHVRRRRVRSIIGFAPSHDVQDMRAVSVDHQSREALQQFYRALEQLRSRDRVAFTLRYVEGMELTEVATALDVSVPTVRRVLAHASERLGSIVKENELLTSYIARRA